MRYGKSMSETILTILAEIREGFSPKEIKMAIGVASDPRYKQGNYTGAYKQIEKIKKGLASHPQVAAVLKRQNEGDFEKVKCHSLLKEKVVLSVKVMVTLQMQLIKKTNHFSRT